MKKVALGLIEFYQEATSSTTHNCRYQPTCSYYGYEAIEKYGCWKGGWMTAWRIVRCSPLSKGGFDPVP